MKDYNQLSFIDSQFSNRKKKSKMIVKLQEIGNFVNWNKILKVAEVIDKSGTSRGGRPRKPLLWMIKMLFIQDLYNLSDPELEDQMIDRLSFQEFVGINFNNEIPDFTTLWRFKEALIGHKILDKIFDLILEQLETEGLILKRGTIVDATIIKSKNRPLSKRQQKRNKQYSKIRAKVEHPFAYIKSKLKYRIAMATNLARNKLKFDMCVIIYNINRGIFLLKQKAKAECYA